VHGRSIEERTPVSKPTEIERSVLANVKAGRLAVEGLGEGKTLALAQRAVQDLLMRGWLRLAGARSHVPFAVTPAGQAALETKPK
jgi:hypothetical protein